ncbi:RidA family protein [Labrys wisconsinensis]|uniref:2-iminobutanoate/2-iminopropanoate deaminase n=1 Tax=Labrys wisconsinensis TaxID=425677 RepID=A0ABU0J961_9HYPH|nr:RidA family protein [Labrys wisconsinensis]MDQ0470815.1 2-iminobutanoate/2-iminopropanoate deaminase [Labrys wisconsinensis]
MIERIAEVPGGARRGGHYSHAVIAHGFVHVSGQGPADPQTGRIPDGFADQVRQTLANVRTILLAAGADMTDVVKVTAYLTDVTRFAEYNAVYKEFFPTDLPARTTVGAQLIGIQVEIDCVAAIGGERA